PNTANKFDPVPPTYGPSTTVNYELGFKSRLLDRRLSIDADVFYIDWSKIQLTGIFYPLETTYFFNGGKARSDGTEIAIEFKPVEDLTISATAAYIDAELTETVGNGFPGIAGN